MTFHDCLMECARNQELVNQFSRLTGRKVGVATTRSPLEAMIDQATGFQETLDKQMDDDLRAFVEFCHEVVWSRLPVAA